MLWDPARSGSTITARGEPLTLLSQLGRDVTEAEAAAMQLRHPAPQERETAEVAAVVPPSGEGALPHPDDAPKEWLGRLVNIAHLHEALGALTAGAHSAQWAALATAIEAPVALAAPQDIAPPQEMVKADAG